MIILMGLAGSGKSTQGKILAAARGAVWLSAGQVLRDTADPAVRAIQDRGELVDDRETIRLMTQAIAQALAAGKDVILDGYPRTIEQAEWLVANAAERVSLVIIIDVPKADLIERMRLRGRSDDQDMAAIEERFRIVEENIATICEILAAKGIKIVHVDGSGTPDEVTALIRQTVAENEEMKHEAN